jgi:hypothetical protein
MKQPLRPAERYGYVNRALPGAEWDGFVDVLARRIASFDRRAIAAAKNLMNQVWLQSADRLGAASATAVQRRSIGKESGWPAGFVGCDH